MKHRFFFSALLLMGLLSSCSLLTARRLRIHDLPGLIVSESSAQPRTLRVRVDIFSSIDSPTSFRSRVRGNCIELTLWAAWTDNGGPLDFDFVVPDSVDEVRLGTDHTLLWDRELGSRYTVSRLKALMRRRKPDSHAPPVGVAEFDWDRWLKGTLFHPVHLPVPGKVSAKRAQP
jgi:hypothetical protein